MNSIPFPAASLLVAVGVQVLCQLFKFVVYSIRDRRVSPHYLVTAGGMPSAHAAFVTALTTAVALRSGIHSDVFAVAFVFAAIVAYDAYRLRGHVQEHAKWINRLRAKVRAQVQSEAGAGRPGEIGEGELRPRAGDSAGEPGAGEASTDAELRPRVGDNAGEPEIGEASTDAELRPRVVSEMVGHSVAEIVAGIAFGLFGAVAVSAAFL